MFFWMRAVCPPEGSSIHSNTKKDWSCSNLDLSVWFLPPSQGVWGMGHGRSLAHIEPVVGEGGEKLRRLRWFSPPSPDNRKGVGAKGVLLYLPHDAWRGGRTISNAEVPSSPPQIREETYFRLLLPHPSISLAGRRNPTDKYQFTAQSFRHAKKTGKILHFLLIIEERCGIVYSE